MSPDAPPPAENTPSAQPAGPARATMPTPRDRVNSNGRAPDARAQVVTTIEPAKTPVRIPFVCPICTAGNAIELVVLSRAGGAECVKCKKWLKAADVMRAIHRPRAEVEEGREVRLREPPAKKPAMVWPPTAESRAAIAPLRKQRGDGK